MKQPDYEVRIWLIAGVILALGLSVTFIPLDLVGAKESETKRTSKITAKPDKKWKESIKKACFQFVDNKPANAEPKKFNLNLSKVGTIKGFKAAYCECLSENFVRLLQRKRETEPEMDLYKEARFFQRAYSVPKGEGRAKKAWVKEMEENSFDYTDFMGQVQNGCNRDKNYKAPLNI
jgi:hypothetical protein